ncbi:zinc metalloprotease [Methanosarcina horonobensis]|uniref:hypothetical protein n=1 Tax=Methanosarcina horonobensis TaxID=418008 RepID=UPI000ADE6548|nr:hypothetical protein [Methanosarcina horonobensis]
MERKLCSSKLDSSVPSSWSSPIKAATTAWNDVGAGFTFKWMTSAAENRIYCANDGLGVIAFCIPTRSSSGYNTRYTMYFNTYYSWSTSSDGTTGCYDVQNIATHEFGHWLTLDDLADPADSEKKRCINMRIPKKQRKELFTLTI